MHQLVIAENLYEEAVTVDCIFVILSRLEMMAMEPDAYLHTLTVHGLMMTGSRGCK